MASASMETTLEASTITAAAAGQLIVGPKDAESICGWLAIGRIALLEIWAEADAGSETGQTMDLTSQSKIDRRILAMTAIPRGQFIGSGNGEEDHLLLAKDALVWDLVLLRPERRSEADRAVSIQLVVLATGSLGSGPRRHLINATLESVMLTVWRPSAHLARARGKGDRHGENDSEMVAACLCDGTLALLAFYGTDEQKSGIDGVVSSQATFPITSDARRRKINDTSKNCPDLQGAHERLQAVASRTTHPRAPAVATDVLDLAFVNGDGRERAEPRDMRPVIAILVDETVDGDLERGRDRRPQVALRTWRWDSNCGGALSPGDWRVEKLHPDTSIAALSGGGILCVGPDGVRAFGDDGCPLLGVGRSRGQDLMTSVPVSARCHWGSKAPAALTRVPNAVGGEARNGRGRREAGEREDFIMMDVGGALHRISIFDSHDSVNAVGVDHRAGQEAQGGDSCRGRRHTRIDCAKLEARPGPASPILARVNFLLPVGSDGLVFIGGHYSSLQTIARLFSDDSSALPVGSYRSSRLLSADSTGASDTPATSWLTVQQLEEDGGGLGPVSGIVAIGGSGTRRCNRPTFFDGRHETPPTEVFRDFGDVESPGPRVTPEGFRAVLATGRRGDTAGSGEDPATGVCTLEHGLALDTVAEGSTGLPAGATLFTVPLTPRILEGCRCHRPGHDIRATRGASGKVEGDDARGGGHLLLFSDRARWTTCVSMVSRDGVFLPVVEPKGFASNRHTIHLGHVEPGGYIVQVTEDSVNLIEPAGLLSACSWRPASPSFRVQHAATAGAVVAVSSENTIVLLSLEALTRQVARTAGGASGASSEAMLTEVCRMRLGYSVSALGMRSLGNAAKEEKNGTGGGNGGGGGGGGGKGAATPSVLIAIASWDCPVVKVLLWPTPPTSDARTAPSPRPDVPDGSTLAEVATWRLPVGVQAGAEGEPNQAGEWAAGGAQEAATLTRSLAFAMSEDVPRRLSLVAATAGGAVAVAECWTSEDSEEERGREKKAGKDWMGESWMGGGCRDKLVTSASFQVGHGPVRLEVFDGEDGGKNEREHGGKGFPELCRGGERVFVHGGISAVLCRRPGAERSRARGQDTWRCVQVCSTGRYSRHSVVHLPHEGSGTERGDADGKFAWLTTRESSAQDTNPDPCSSTPGGVRAIDATKSNDASGSHDHSPPRWTFLSIGTLSKQTRAQCYKKSLLLSPTHLVYAPTTRSIVMACNEYRGKTAVAKAATSGASRADARQVLSPPSCLSSLRVFDADTLEERPGGPLHLLPGIRITGMAQLGVDPLRNASHGMGTRAPWADVAGGSPPAAVGGDVIAVACCSARAHGERTPRHDDGQREHVDVQRQRGDGVAAGSITAAAAAAAATAAIPVVESDAKDECKPDTLGIVLAAFEVVAYAGHVAADAKGGVGRSSSCCKISDANVGGTTLAPLAAAPEMEGVCFNLETLSGRFVAASVDEKVVVYGWNGSGGGLRPDQPAPPLALSPVASCRTSVGRCVTALSTSGGFIAVAEFLHSVSLYRFDPMAKSISLVARHARSSLIVTALALSPEPLSGDTGFPIVALADQTTGTVAILACSHPRSSCTRKSQGSTAAPNAAAAVRGGGGGGGNSGGGGIGSGGGGGGGDGGVSVSGVVGVGDDGERNQGIERGGNGITGGSIADKLESIPAVDPLRLVAVWPCPNKVTSLEAAEATSKAQLSGLEIMDSVFMLGTAAGAVSTVRVSPPYMPP